MRTMHCAYCKTSQAKTLPTKCAGCSTNLTVMLTSNETWDDLRRRFESLGLDFDKIYPGRDGRDYVLDGSEERVERAIMSDSSLEAMLTVRA